jgi:hypothetical protein
MESLVRRIRIGATLQMPSMRLPAQLIETLEPGALLRFDLPAGASGEWRVAGQQMGRARAVRRGSLRAAFIESCLGGDQ